MEQCTLQHEIKKILKDIKRVEGEITKNKPTKFLDDGYVVSSPKERIIGDSRYVYGNFGFNYWVHASGYMYANDGLFSLFTRKKEGDDPVIAFFLGFPKDNAGKSSYIPLSLLPVPVLDNPIEQDCKRFSVMSQDASYFFTMYGPILGVVRVFVTEENTPVYSIYVENNSDIIFPLYTSSYFRPFCRHQMYDTDEDRWFCQITLPESMPDEEGIFASGKIEVNEDLDRFHSVSHFASLQGRYTTGKESYLRKRHTTTSSLLFSGDYRRNLTSALALQHGSFTETRTITTFNDIAIAADINHFDLGPKSNLRLDYSFACKSTQIKEKTSFNPDKIDRDLLKLQHQNKRYFSSLDISFSDSQPSLPLPDQELNQFIGHLKYQVSICALLKGYMQLHPRSLIGIRDIFQALEGMMYYRPEDARQKMLEGLQFTTMSGRCLRQYALPEKGESVVTADVRPFIDQGEWVITTIHRYLQYTGDKEFLREAVAYCDITDENQHVVSLLDHQDSVLEHLFRIMDYLDKHRDPQTKLLCSLYGDWNDALDGLGISADPSKAYGTGVSIMATLHFYQNCQEMIDIITTLFPDDYSEHVRRYQIIQEEIAKNAQEYAIVRNEGDIPKILHGWGDKRSYLVGGYCDSDGASRDSLTSNAFWVISGMLERTPELENTIVQAFNRLDSKYGLRTFNPAFPQGMKGVGRIPKLPPGTAENGASYIHATLFGIMALFQMGYPKKAWEQLYKILPFTDIHHRYSHSPFIMPNSYIYNLEKGLDGESMNDWQTGSSNVLLKILLWYVLGYMPTFQALRIQPASWLPYKTFTLKTTIRGSSFHLIYRREGEGGACPKREFILGDGEVVSGTYCPKRKTDFLEIPYEKMKDDYKIIVVDSYC